MEESQLRVFILTELPDDGEWFHDGYKEFIKLAHRLVELGMSIDEIKVHLVEIYSAVSAEYSS